MIKLAEPNVSHMVDALSEAVSISRRIVPQEMHERVRAMYNWLNVAHRTEIVYDQVALAATPTLALRLCRYASCGPFSGLLAVLLATLVHLYASLCEVWWPARAIERCVDSPWQIDAAYSAGLRVPIHNGASAGNSSSGGGSSKSMNSGGSNSSSNSGGSGDRMLVRREEMR